MTSTDKRWWDGVIGRDCVGSACVFNDLQNKQNTNQFMADQLAVGKEAFINMLRASLTEEVEEVEAEA